MSVDPTYCPPFKGRITSFEDERKQFETYVLPLVRFGWEVELVNDLDSVEERLANLTTDVVLMDRVWIGRLKNRGREQGDHWLMDIFYETAYPATIVLSNFPEPNAIVFAMRHGAYEFIQK